MRLSSIVSAAALAGSSAGLTLDIPTATRVVTVGIPPHQAQITAAVAKRGGLNQTCAQSVYNRAFNSTISNEELASAFSSALSSSDGSTNSADGNLCTVTLASSLSSDYISYLSAMRSRYSSATDYLRNVHTDCSGPFFQVSLKPMCTQESLTAVFTGSGSPKTTSLPPVPPSSGVSIDVDSGNVSMINLGPDDQGSDAPELGSALGSVAAMAVVAGVALML